MMLLLCYTFIVLMRNIHVRRIQALQIIFFQIISWYGWFNISVWSNYYPEGKIWVFEFFPPYYWNEKAFEGRFWFTPHSSLQQNHIDVVVLWSCEQPFCLSLCGEKGTKLNPILSSKLLVYISFVWIHCSKIRFMSET